MRSSGRRIRPASSGSVDASIIVAFFVTVFVIVLAWRYTDSVALTAAQGDLDRFTALSTATAAIGSFFAFVVLALYTRETYLLRRATERQLEAASRPLLILVLCSTPRQLSSPMILEDLLIRNIGTGPAFNISIDKLIGDGVAVEFQLPNTAYIEEKESVGITPLIFQNSQLNGISELVSLLASLFERNKFCDQIVTIQFESIHGKAYHSKHRVQYCHISKALATRLIP